MFLSSNDIIEGSTPLFCKWIRFFPSDQTEYLIVAFSLSIHVYREAQDKLELLLRQNIHAPILELEVIPREFPSPDRLLLLLQDCNKVSILEWINFKFVNVELHHYPEHIYRLEISGPESTDDSNRLAIDPDGRSIALRLHRNYLAIIPQSIDSALLDEIDRLPSWVTLFSEIDERFKHVNRISFLPGYIEPTFAILGSSSTQIMGKLSSPKDQTWFAIVTVQLVSQKFNTIYFLNNLPNDLTELFSIPRPTGGVLVYGPNSVIHIEQGSPGIGLSLNSYTSRLSSFKYNNFYRGEACLYNPSAVCWNENTVLFGAGFTLTLKKTGRFVSKLELKPVEFVNASLLALNRNGILVSCKGDYLTLSKVSSAQSFLERAKSTNNLSAIEDTDLYLAEISEETVTSGHLNFQNLDSLTCTCFVKDLAINTENDDLAFVTEGGSFILIPDKFPFNRVTSFELSGAYSIWSIRVKDSSRNLLLISTQTSTLALIKDKDRIKEVESSDFYLEGPTLFASSTSNYIVQVTSEQIIIIDPSTFSMVSSCKINIEKTAISSDYIAILSPTNTLTVYLTNTGNGKIEQIAEINNVVTFDFDPQRKALWVVDKTGGLGCFVEPFSSSSPPVYFNSNFSGFPQIAANHLIQTTTVKSPFFPVTNIKLHPNFLIISNEHQLSFYRIFGNTLVKVFSKFIGKDVKEFFVSHDYLIVLGYSESFIIHLETLSISNLDSNVDSISFFSRNSFVAVNRTKSSISICTISSFLKWSSILGPHYITHVGESVSHVLYHPASNCYLAISQTKTNWKLPTDEYSSISDQQEADVADCGPMPVSSTYKLHIVSSLSWTVVDTFSLHEYEVVLELKLSTLDTKQTSSGHKAFITLGTAITKGEDRPVRGRALVLDVVEVVPEPGRPETNVKLRLLAGQEVKGPVTTHCDINGCLLVSMAGKIIIHAFENDDSLLGIAFVDTGVASISSAVIKNYFIVGDISMGVSFYAFQKDPPKIAPLGRDLSHSGYIMEFRSVEFCLNGKDTLIIGADQQMSLLHFYTYSPFDKRSGSGQKLLYLGCIKLLSLPVKLLRVANSRKSDNHCLDVLVLCIDGSIKRISPIDEVTFRKGFALSSRFSSQLITPQAGGVLPRSIIGKPFGKAYDLPHPTFSSLIDLSFLHRNIFDLTRPQQHELSKIVNLEIFDIFRNIR